MMQINLYICTDGNEDTRITTENNIVFLPLYWSDAREVQIKRHLR